MMCSIAQFAFIQNWPNNRRRFRTRFYERIEKDVLSCNLIKILFVLNLKFIGLITTM